MTKEEYINTYGKKAYLTMMIQNRERIRRMRGGFKGTGRGRVIIWKEEDL